MITADLHMHSNHSDGAYALEDLVTQIKSAGLSCMALTDHDTVSGCDQAARLCKAEGLGFIHGIEISARPVIPQAHCHILGLWVDTASPSLLELIEQHTQARRERASKVVRILNDLDVHCTLQELQQIAGNSEIIRPHIAHAIVQAGGAASFEQAMKQFLNPGAPAHIPWEKVSAAQAIEVIHTAGGVAVLAHPPLTRLTGSALDDRVGELRSMGLDGIESRHPYHSLEDQAAILKLASKHDLRLSAGSDFHHPEDRQHLGQYGVTETEMTALMAHRLS